MLLFLFKMYWQISQAVKHQTRVNKKKEHTIIKRSIYPNYSWSVYILTEKIF